MDCVAGLAFKAFALSIILGIGHLAAVDVVVTPTTFSTTQIIGGHYANTLTTQGTVVVASGANITFNAVSSIGLNPGFSVASGGVFHAGLVSANTAPTVATAAAVSPSPVTGTTATLSALGADDDGEPGLTYTWATTGTPPAAVAFSANGTNAAKTVTATFTKAGSYSFLVTITDKGGLTATSAVSATVAQTFTSVAVAPASASVIVGKTQQYTATGNDQFGAALASQPGFTYAVSGGGTISASGLFTAGTTTGGPFTITATSGAISGTASATVVNATPTVATAAAATPSPATGTTTTLSVLGADDGGEPSLAYTWATTGTPPAAVAFSANGTNAAKSTVATFSKVGSYSFQVTIKDVGNLSVTSSVTVTVSPTLTTVAVAPASATVVVGNTQQYTATGKDQFATALTSQPTFTWSTTGGGTISSGGLFTASTVGGPFTITATSGGKSGTATATVVNAAPTVATAAAATPSPATGTTTALSVLGADDGGEPKLVYTWATTGTPPAPVTFSVNGTNAAKATTATFTAAGSYSFQVTIKDLGNLTVTSSVTVTVNQTLTTVAVTPTPARVNPNATQQFTATAKDQFGTALTTQPTFTWTVSGGGTISTGGLFTAGATAGGPFTVTATSGATSGTASVTVNAAPTVATAAAATPSPVTGTTTVLSVLGADDAGESGLVYTWATTGTPPASVAFSANGTNTAKSSTATFTKAGSYSFQVTITDGGNLTVTSSVTVTVNQTLTTVAVTPTPARVNPSATQQFTATAKDQFATALTTQPTFTWTASGGGTISTSGLFTAGATAGGPFTVTATSGATSGAASVTVNAAPTVATAAAATPNPATGTTTVLSVLGADDAGESGLVYTWATTGTPPASVAFSANGTNAAKSSTATFTKAGSYSFQVTIKDSGNQTATSSVTVTVNQTLTTVAVTPTPARVNPNATQQFTATGNDQFGTALTTQPTFTWTVSGGGTISTGGLFTAGATAGGPFTVTATSGAKSGTASVTVNAAPTVATAAAATPNSATGSTTVLSVLGADDAGEPALTYTWATTGTPPAAVAFSANGTNAAKSSTATFTKAGSYSFQVTIKDGGNLTVTSSVTVTVNQTLTTVAVAPASASVPVGGTQQYTATGKDQFGTALTTQPTFTWTVSGGGTISTAGLFTAGATTGGPFTVTATSGGKSGTASVTVNAAPTVATAASATPNPVTGTTTLLSVLGADDGGEANLTYTWATTGTPPASVAFSANGTNAAKSSTATFTKAGSYSFQVTIKDSGNLTVTSSVTVTVNQTLTTVAVTPTPARVNPSATQQFTATAKDQFGTALTTQPTFTWTASGGGTISATGLFTAGATAGGPFTVTATSGATSGTASVTVNAAPTVATAAAATPNPATGTTTVLSVLGADDAGESGLVYTWATTGTPPASVAFSANGTNAAKSSTATFTKAGSYSFQVTIKDSGNLTVTSSVTVTVNQTLTTVAVTPTPARVNPSSTQQFTATAKDQFGAALATQPTFTWTVSGGGTISATGLFTAGATTGGPFTVTATSGAKSGTASVTVNAAPTVATAAAATPSPATGTTTVLSVLGADDAGEPALTYTWATTGTPPASVAFSANGTNAAKSSTATFTKAGSYSFQVTIKDSGNLTVTSSVTVTVNQTLTTVAVAPASASVAGGGTQQFTATANDQFGTALTTQPAFTWTVSGGGTISTGGLFTAGATGGGPFTVTATTGATSGTAAVTVTNAAPTVATAAAATPNPATGTTTALSVLGADDGGEPNLTYTWATTGTPPASVAFSANGTNAAKSSTATFTKAGSYALQVTIKDLGNLTVTSSVTVTVSQTLTTVAVTPASATVISGNTQQYTATGKDQFGTALTTQPTFTWTVSGGGTISTGGLFTAGATVGGPFTVTAASGGKSGTATATVTNAAPTVATAAAAAPNPATGTTTALSVLGADDGGEAQLIYTWATTGTPPASVAFSANGTNAAKSTVATFTKAGSYSFQVTIKDLGNLTVTSSVTVVVNQTLTTVAVAPASATVISGNTQQYTATGKDQFGTALVSQPTFTWTVSGGGTISTGGLFTAGATVGGPFTVTAASGGKSGTATATVTNAAPTVATAAAATPSPATGTTTTLSALGADDGGEPKLTYSWALIGAPPANVTFSANGTNAAKATTATFTKAGSYSFQVTIQDAGGLTASSNVTVTVNQTLTTIAVAPTAATVNTGGTQQFAATALDQFGVPTTAQPTFTWSVSGGGSVSAGGLFTAGTSAGGPFTVTAASGGKTGTAATSVTIGNVASGLALIPSSPTVALGGTLQFRTMTLHGDPLPSPLVWTVSGGGTISQQGLFTASSSGGPFAVGVSGGGLSASTPIFVAAAPTITSAAHASPQPATGKTVALSVAGRDSKGATNLSCNWTLTGASPSGAGFSVNGGAGAQSTIMTCAQAGTYHVLATLSDASGLTVTSSVDVVVVQTASALAVSPSAATVDPGKTQAFTVAAVDQFGLSMTMPSSPTWSVTGGGSIASTTGIFTAGSANGGPYTVTAMASGLSGTAMVSVAQVPIFTSVASATPNPVTGTTVTLKAQASDPLNGGAITYTWTNPAGSQSGAEFSDNGTATASTTVATLAQSGTYLFQVIAAAAGGLTSTSTVSVTVVPTFTAIFIDQSTSPVVVALNGSRTFTVTAADQFHIPMALGTAPTWSVSGGGTITQAGVFTATTVGGPFTVTASSGGVSGTATLSVARPPSITVAAKATPNPVAGISTALSVTANDDHGASVLSYSWTSSGSEPTSFSVQSGATANNTTVTFYQAGTYLLQVTVTDDVGLSTTSSVSVTVAQTFSGLSIVPSSGLELVVGASQAFALGATDQFQSAMTVPAVTWSCTGGGTVDTSGVFHATATGPFTVTATSGAIHATASGTVGTQPTVAIAAAANPTTVTGKTTALTVLGADTAGASGLTYTWAMAGGAYGSVSFSPNGNNAAQSSTATFGVAGVFPLQVTIANAAGLSVVSYVTVTVVATPTTVTVTPATINLLPAGTQAFSAVVQDQFGANLVSPPAITWSAAGGSIDASGLYTAGTTSGGPFTITATAGSIHGTASAKIGTSPTITSLTASPSTVTASTTALALVASDAGGASGLIYDWSVALVGGGYASYYLSDNDTNTAKNATLTFYQAGSYLITGMVKNQLGLSAVRTTTVTVQQSLAGISVTPIVYRLPQGSTQQFTAQGRDQFGQAMTVTTAQWAVSGGGSITTGGLYTASTVSSSVMVTATCSGLTPASVSFPVGQGPSFTTAATASPSTVSGTTTVVSAVATPGGGTTVNYYWSVAPSTGASIVADSVAPLGHEANVTFTQAGTYVFTVTATNDLGYSATSSVQVQVLQIPTLSLQPTTVTLPRGGRQVFSAAISDQFGAVVPTALTWSLSGPGSLSTVGVYDAGTTDGATATVTVTGAGKTANASVRVADGAPTIVAPASASPNPSTSPTVALAVQAVDDGGASNLTFTWQSLNPSAGTVTFATNGTANSSQTSATFAKPGTYPLRVTVADTANHSVTSDVSVVVNAAFGAPVFSPGPSSAAILAPASIALSANPADGPAGGDTGIWYTTGTSPVDPVPGQSGCSLYLQPIVITQATTFAARRVRIASDGTMTLGTIGYATYAVIDPTQYQFVSGSGGTTSATSPACIEITGPTDGISVAIDHDGIRADDVHVVGANLCYANVPLAIGRATAVDGVMSGASGGPRTISKTVTWSATDLTGDSGIVILVRRGDSLLLTAHGSGTRLGIDSGQGGSAIVVAAGTQVPVMFPNPGIFTCVATLDDVAVGTAQVVVVDLPFNQSEVFACEVNYKRSYHTSFAPSGHGSDISFVSADPAYLTVSLDSETYSDATLGLTPLKSGHPMLLARLGGATGPIISHKEVSEFVLEGSHLDGLIFAPYGNPQAGIAGAGPGIIRIRPYIPGLQVDVKAANSADELAMTAVPFISGPSRDPVTGEPVGHLAFTYTMATPAGIFPYSAVVRQYAPDPADPAATIQVQVSSGVRWSPALHSVHMVVANHANPSENTDAGATDPTKRPLQSGMTAIDLGDLGLGFPPQGTWYRGQVDVTATLSPPSPTLAAVLELDRSESVQFTHQPTLALVRGQDGQALSALDTVIAPPSSDLSIAYYLVADLVGDASNNYNCLGQGIFASPGNSPVIGVSQDGTSSWRIGSYDASTQWHNSLTALGVSGGPPYPKNNVFPALEISADASGTATVHAMALADPSGNPGGYAQLYRPGYLPIGVPVPLVFPPGANSISTLGDDPAGFIGTTVFGIYSALPGGIGNGTFDIVQSIYSNYPNAQAGLIDRPDPTGPLRFNAINFEQSDSSGQYSISADIPVTAFGAGAYSAWVSRSTDHLKVTCQMGGSQGTQSMPDGILEGTLDFPATPVTRNQYGITNSAANYQIHLSISSTKDEDATALYQVASLPRRAFRLVSFTPWLNGSPDDRSPVTEAFPGHAWINVITGNLFFDARVATYATAAMGPDLSVSYNSLSNIDCGLGTGWRTNYDMRVYRLEDKMVVVDESGGKNLCATAGNLFVADSASRMPGAQIVVQAYDQATGAERCSAAESYKLIRGDRRLYFFNADGWLVRVRDQLGDELHVQRDPHTGFATEVDDDHGRKQLVSRAAFQDSATGRQPMAALSAGASGSWAFAYDAHGNLTSISLQGAFSFGSALTYGIHYDQTSDAATSVDYPSFASTSFSKVITKAQTGYAWQVTEPLGGKTLIEGYGPNTIYSVTDATGVFHRIAPQSPTRLLSATFVGAGYWNGSTITADLPKIRMPRAFTYDDRYQLIAETLYNAAGIERQTTIGYVTIPSAFGWNGQATAVSERRVHAVAGLDGVGPQDLVTAYTYETKGKKLGLISSKTEPDGSKSTYAYNDSGYLTGMTDGRGGVWVYADFDAYGQPKTVTSPAGVVTTYTYAPDGSVLTSTDAQSHDKVTYAYDAQQRLASRQLNSMTAETFTYDPLGHVSKTTDVQNRVFNYEYDALGRPTKVSEGAGDIAPVITTYQQQGNFWLITTTQGAERKSQIKVDATGRIVADTVQRYLVNGAQTVTDCTTTHEYDPTFGWETKITDPTGATTQLDRDYQGRVITVTGPTLPTATPVTKATYNGLGWPLTVTDPDGLVTTTRYDRTGRAVLVINPAGGWVRQGYDADGNLTSIAPSMGAAETFEYDGDGVQTAYVDRIGRRHTTAIDRSARTITSGLDGLAMQSVVRHLDQRGYVDNVASFQLKTTFGHTEDGTTNLVQIPGRSDISLQPDNLSRITTISRTVPIVSDPNHVASHVVVYDPSTGRPTSSTDPAKHLVQPLRNVSTGEDYGVADNGQSGNLATTTTVHQLLDQDANGFPHIYADAVGRRTTEVHDALGRLTSRTPPSGLVTTWLYSPGGLVTSMIRGSVTTTYAHNALGQVTSTSVPGRNPQTATYDALGLLLQRSDGLTTTVYSYYPVSRLLSQTVDSTGKSTSYLYDTRGRATDVQDNQNHGAHYTYDDLDRVAGITHADGKTEGFTYYPTGEVQTHTDRANRTVTYGYDLAGRLAGKTYRSSGSTVTYGLDLPATGGAVETVQFGADTTTRASDVRGRLATLTLPGASPLAFGYNGADQVLSKGATTYDYDTQGRLWHITIAGQGTATFTYDANSRVQGVSLPNGVTRTFGYDGAGAVTSLVQQIGTAANIENWTVTRDGQGHITQLTGPTGLTIVFTYDASGRLVQESRSGDLPLLTQYAYDGADNRTDVVSFAAPVAKADAFATSAGSEIGAASGGTWTVTSGALSATASALATSVPLTLATSPAVGGPEVKVTVKPAVVANTPGLTNAAGFTATASDGSTYRALWQLGPPGTGFSPPPAFARLVVQHVVGSTVTTLAAGDWASDTANGASLSLIVWPDQRVTVRATPAGSSSTLRLDVATPGISSTTTLTLGLVAVAEVSGHGASTFDDLSWTSATSRTAKHSTFDPFNTQTAEDVVSTDSAQDGRHRTFTYNAQGQLTARNLAIGAGAPAPEAGYGYDELDRLTTATVGGATTTYAYLGDSWLRRSATVGTTVTAWTYDGKSPLTQTVTVGGTAQPTTSYLVNNGMPLWEATSGSVLTYAHDPLGNVGGLVGPVTNGTTTVNAYARRFTYDAFGNVVREQLGQLDGSGNPILVTLGSAASAGMRYKGMWFDGGALNLYKTQTRSYAPDLGRFTQLDPARAGQNWYAAMGGDPVNRSDPTGLYWIYDLDHRKWNYVPDPEDPPGEESNTPNYGGGEGLFALSNLLYSRGGQLSNLPPTALALTNRQLDEANYLPRVTKPPPEDMQAAGSLAKLGLTGAGLVFAPEVTIPAIFIGAGISGTRTAIADPNASASDYAFAGLEGGLNGGSLGVAGPVVASSRVLIGAATLYGAGTGASVVLQDVQQGRGDLALFDAGVTALVAGFGAAQASPRLNVLNYEVGLSTGVTSSSRAGGTLGFNFKYVGPSGIKVGPYSSFKGELQAGEQAHHLNQDAAFSGIIPKSQGMSTVLRGNAFSEPGTPHYEVHASLEKFWAPFRLSGVRPTVGQYNNALREALIAGRFGAEDVEALLEEAAASQGLYGLSSSDLIPRIPGPINQTKP